MRNIFTVLFVGNIFLLLNACTKTGVNPAEKIVKEQANERIMDTASYSRWLSAKVPSALLVKHYTVISGTPRTLTADILKNGKVLVFGRDGKLYQPHSLPFEHSYEKRLNRSLVYYISRRTYFRDQVAKITVYDSLMSSGIYSNWPPFALTNSYYTSEFRCIIVSPSLKSAANVARLNWNDYTAVTSYFKIAP